MSMFFRIVAIVFGVLYVVALALYGIGTFGWFGQEPGPLAGVFLVPLGLPWNSLLSGAPEALLPWVGLLSPLVNLAILLGLSRVTSRRG